MVGCAIDSREVDRDVGELVSATRDLSPVLLGLTVAAAYATPARLISYGDLRFVRLMLLSVPVSTKVLPESAPSAFACFGLIAGH